MDEEMNACSVAAKADAKADLRFICNEITAVLRYAEGKHGVFLAFNGVALFNCISLLRSLPPGHGELIAKGMLLATMALLLCAMATSMYSFLPQILEHQAQPDPKGKNNLLFFEHIKEHSVDSYIRTLCDEYGAESCAVTTFERCLVAPIIVNARLSSRKFRLFRNAAYFDLVAIILGIGGFVLHTTTV